MTLTHAHILAARDVLAQKLQPTPLLHHTQVGSPGELWLKCESLQPTGSFKIRGATYRLSLLTADQRRAGVVAYSTGNHAQAVARAAGDAGIPATIVMSPDVPEMKVKATERWGATVLMAEPTSAARRALAEKVAEETGATLIPPYNDFDIMAGQGTIACEIQDQLGSLENTTLYVPIGGGGLLAGVATAAKSIHPGCRVIGVEPAWEDDAAKSFKARQLIAANGPSNSIADAIKVQVLGELTFPLILQHVDDVVTVSEAEILAASLRLFEEYHLVVEPGGAVGFAVAAKMAAITPGRHVALLCGGNISLERLNTLKQRQG